MSETSAAQEPECAVDVSDCQAGAPGPRGSIAWDLVSNGSLASPTHRRSPGGQSTEAAAPPALPERVAFPAGIRCKRVGVILSDRLTCDSTRFWDTELRAGGVEGGGAEGEELLAQVAKC